MTEYKRVAIPITRINRWNVVIAALKAAHTKREAIEFPLDGRAAGYIQARIAVQFKRLGFRVRSSTPHGQQFTVLWLEPLDATPRGSRRSPR